MKGKLYANKYDIKIMYLLFLPELKGQEFFSTHKLSSGPSVWIHVTNTTEPRPLPLMTKDNLIYW